MDIKLANPSGFCSHIHYPEDCEICTREAELLTLLKEALEMLECWKGAYADQEAIPWLNKMLRKDNKKLSAIRKKISNL